MSMSKFAAIVALAAVSIASPAFAQGQSHEGSQLPHYFDSSGGLVWGSWGPAQASPVVNHRVARSAPDVYARSARDVYLSAPSGLGAFAAAPLTSRPDPNSTSPARSGGGSVGYNENLLKDY
jgi:hypothetical protein